MNEYGKLKLNLGDKIRTMNYTTGQDKVYMITSGVSNKVSEIKNDNHAELVIGTKILTGTISIISDEDAVNKMFNKMTNESNNHFKQLRPDLVILEFSA